MGRKVPFIRNDFARSSAVFNRKLENVQSRLRFVRYAFISGMEKKSEK